VVGTTETGKGFSTNGVINNQLAEPFNTLIPLAHRIGDADTKWAVFEQDTLQSLGVAVNRMARCPISSCTCATATGSSF